MKTLLLLLLPALLLTGCDVEKFTSAPATPAPATPRAATPKPTPAPGDWMWKKDRGNPLEKKPSN